MHRFRRWLPIVFFGLLAGCHPGRDRVVPFDPPHARALAPADCPCRPGSPPPVVTAAALGAVPPDPAADPCPMRRPRNVLALSSGGAYGAYSAGFMAGWTGSGHRPEFDVVTGISTGSLIAPFAFLGPEYDGRLSRLYTQVQPDQIFRIRAWVSIPFRDSIASTAPLKALLETQITTELMDRIAAEHKKGRRLYVGTTNLDTRRLVVWDMGAIACRPCPEGCRLFRDVLLASCAVPGMFSPVRFDVEVDGKPASELHADGGISAQLFVPSHVFAAAARHAADDAAAGLVPDTGGDPTPPVGNLYVVVAGKLYPDAGPVRPHVLPVLGATTGTLLYAYCRADLANLYGLARASGLKYHLTALRQGFRAGDSSVDFNREAMAKLFREGVEQGTGGPGWMGGPPTLSPGDGDYIRTGLRLRTPPGPPGE